MFICIKRAGARDTALHFVKNQDQVMLIRQCTQAFQESL
jgi:hypothetical protein